MGIRGREFGVLTERPAEPCAGVGYVLDGRSPFEDPLALNSARDEYKISQRLQRAYACADQVPNNGDEST